MSLMRKNCGSEVPHVRHLRILGTEAQVSQEVPARHLPEPRLRRGTRQFSHCLLLHQPRGHHCTSHRSPQVKGLPEAAALSRAAQHGLPTAPPFRLPAALVPQQSLPRGSQGAPGRGPESHRHKLGAGKGHPTTETKMSSTLRKG